MKKLILILCAFLLLLSGCQQNDNNEETNPIEEPNEGMLMDEDLIGKYMPLSPMANFNITYTLNGDKTYNATNRGKTVNNGTYSIDNEKNSIILTSNFSSEDIVAGKYKMYNEFLYRADVFFNKDDKGNPVLFDENGYSKQLFISRVFIVDGSAGRIMLELKDDGSFNHTLQYLAEDWQDGELSYGTYSLNKENNILTLTLDYGQQLFCIVIDNYIYYHVLKKVG